MLYIKKMLGSKEGFNWTSLSIIAAIIAVEISIFGFWWNFRANLKHNMFKEKLRVYREYLSNLGRSATDYHLWIYSGRAWKEYLGRVFTYVDIIVLCSATCSFLASYNRHIINDSNLILTRESNQWDFRSIL